MLLVILFVTADSLLVEDIFWLIYGTIEGTTVSCTAQHLLEGDCSPVGLLAKDGDIIESLLVLLMPIAVLLLATPPP